MGEQSIKLFKDSEAAPSHLEGRFDLLSYSYELRYPDHIRMILEDGYACQEHDSKKWGRNG